jgi:multidrug resistance efflux pump
VQQEYNTQLTKVQNLKNTLNLIPATRKKLQADLARNQAQLAEAKLDLENTTIKAPFDCRITEVKVEKSQFVQKGQVLAVADGTDAAEIRAQVPSYKMNHLVK